jgi:hypothetical protein
MTHVVNFEALEQGEARHAAEWASAKPFELLVVDGFCRPEGAEAVLDSFPDPTSLNRSRDYMFAKAKFEKNKFADLSDAMGALHGDLLSERFQRWLTKVTGRSMFVDPEFHGGGLHSGGQGSFLDMHADFNVHPLHPDWVREVNILLYLNPGWEPAWGGQLKLRDARTGATREIEPRFNRCVVMLTKDHTLHGYDPISFPAGRYRRSVAAYGYSQMAAGERLVPRSTVWKSERSVVRRALAPVVLRLVGLKNRVLGSGSVGNR